MIELIGDMLTIHRTGRAIPIQRLGAQAGVEALVRMGLSSDCASVFAYSGGDRGKVVALARRKRVIV